MLRRLPLLGLLIAALFSSCRSVPQGPPFTDELLMSESARFLDDTGARRAALEHSLTNPANFYSRQRLASYARGNSGWDLLPEWNPRSRPVTASMALSLEHGEMPEVPASGSPLWDGVRPQTMEGWVSLGRKAFQEFPLRADRTMEYALTRPELAKAVGLDRTADGSVPGLIVFRNVDGAARVGITCALCHSAVENGQLVMGAARRNFDYGRLRLAYFAETGEPLEPKSGRQMSAWGPGRADVTADDNDDPVLIPSLWGLRSQRFLTKAGTIRQDSPLALAIRQETQLIDSNHDMIRPPRAIAWAMAMFVYSLSPPRETVAVSPAASRGAVLFGERCAGCHSNPKAGGRLISASDIGTDPALATGRARGTGFYRTPPLVRVRRGAPFLHDGSVSSLAELFTADRLAVGYSGGRLGPGHIPGHVAGTDLNAADRAALIAFVDTL